MNPAQIFQYHKTVMKSLSYFLLKLVSLAIISTWVGQSWAKEECSSLLESTTLEMKSPKMAEFLSDRAYDRLIRTQPENLRALSQEIMEARNGETDVKIDEENLTVHVYITKSEGKIDVRIGYLSFRPKDKGIWSVLKPSPLGKRSPSLNMIFPRTIAAIAAGLEKLIVADPSLKMISITGSNVVNLALVEQLKEFGFQASSQSIANYFYNGLRREGAYAIWIHNIVTSAGLADHLPGGALPLKLLKYGVLVLTGVRYKELGKSWKIEFQVRHQGADRDSKK